MSQKARPSDWQAPIDLTTMGADVCPRDLFEHPAYSPCEGIPPELPDFPALVALVFELREEAKALRDEIADQRKHNQGWWHK
jgi:hypothetical protein